MVSGNTDVSGAAPLFSVVIPTYNRADLIDHALQSVLAQTCRDFEVIVVDNGGSDNTKEVVARHQSPLIRYHWQKGTGGPAGPRNTGMRLARGKYVAFLDSDDWWYPEKLQKAKEAFDVRPEAQLWHHTVDVVSPRGTHRNVVDVRVPAGWNEYENLLASTNYVATTSVVARREALLALGGFDENMLLSTIEDYDLWLRLAASGALFIFTPDALGALRHWEGNLSTVEYAKRLERLRYLSQRHFAQLRPSSPALSAIKSNFAYLFGRLQHQQGLFYPAIKEYCRSMRGASVERFFRAATGIMLCAARISR